ncbi:MAG: PH domain-containing protein [Bacilli bacterium]|nr:PH domain-containing protein [Bacilli bacterium]
MKTIYPLIHKFRSSFGGGIAWRLKKHSEVVEKHLNPGEEVLYAFCGQKNSGPFEWFDTYVAVITTKRMLFGHKNLLWGYVLSSVTPDMYNDLQVFQGLLWGKIRIDTVKELIILTNLPKNSLDDIETNISEYMMEQKKQYVKEGN